MWRKAVQTVCLVAVLIFSCTYVLDPLNEPVDSNLDQLEVFLSDDTRNELNTSSFQDNYFSGYADFRGARNIPILMKRHGNVSRRFPKKSYTFKILNADQSEIIQNSVLSAEYQDKSLLRTRLSNHLFRESGLMAFDINPVDMYINGVYQGIYFALENVDERFLHKRGRKTSSLYKIILNWFISIDNSEPVERFVEKKLPKKDLSYTDLLELPRFLDKGLSESNKAEFESLVNIENILFYHAVTLAVSHWDGNPKNYYLYFDPDIRKFEIIPWDLNHTFERTPKSLPTHYSNNLIEQVLSVPSYKSEIHRKIKSLFDKNELLALIDSFTIQIEPSYKVDPSIQERNGDLDYESDKVRTYISAMSEVIEKL